MKTIKFSISAALTGLGYFAGSHVGVSKPWATAIFSSQVIGRVIEFVGNGNRAELEGFSYVLGTMSTGLLAIAMEYALPISRETAFLAAGAILAGGGIVMEALQSPQPQLSR